MAGGDGIRAGRAFVELSLRDRVSSQLDAIARKFATWGASLAGVGASIAGALAPAMRVFSDRENIAGWALRLRSSTGTFSQIVSLFRVWGLTTDEVGQALEDMTRKLDTKAVERFADVLQTLGVRSLAHVPLQQRLGLVLEALDRIPDATQRARIAVEVFGERFGMALISSRDLSIGTIERLKNLTAITSDQADAATRIMHSWRQGTANLSAIWSEIASALAPLVETISSSFQSATESAVGWIRENQGLVVSLAAVAAGVATLGVVLLSLAAIIKTITITLAVVSTVFAAVKAAILALLSPIGLVVAALAGLAAVVIATGNDTKKAFSEVRDDVAELASDWIGAFQAIQNYLRSGDLESAFETLTKAIELTWYTMIQSLKKLWWGFVKDLIGFLRRNPWILTLAGAGAGALIGGPTGAVIGGLAGTGGALALEYWADDIHQWIESNARAGNEKIDALRRDLRMLIARSNRPALPPGAEPPPPEELYVAPPPRDFKDQLLALGEARGTFTAFAALQQFQYGTKAMRKQEDLLEEILKEVRKVQQNVDRNMKVK